MPLTGVVRKFLSDAREPGRETALLTGDDSLVVAVSGGPDSLALLHILVYEELIPKQRIVVAHLDHGLRPSSAEEARFVATTAAKWGVQCYVKTIDVSRKAAEASLSLEDAGRQARYRFLAEVAGDVGATVIATGHNADDQAETVLMHFLRGTGLAGLRGMLPISQVLGSPHLTLIRPLLSISRTEIDVYCRRHGLEALVDESNRDTSFFRNRIRHELLPILERYNPQIKERLGQTAAIAASDYDLLTSQTNQAWKRIVIEQSSSRVRFILEPWRLLPVALQRSVLRRAVEKLLGEQLDVGFRTIEQARRAAVEGIVGTEAWLPGDLVLTVEYETFEITTTMSSPDLHDLPQLPDVASMNLTIPGECKLAGGWRLVADLPHNVDLDTVLVNQDQWQAFIDVGDASELVVRSRIKGERFMSLGMSQMIRLKEVMINRKIPSKARERWPIVASRNQLIWIVGHVIDERFRVRPETSRIVHLRAERTVVS